MIRRSLGEATTEPSRTGPRFATGDRELAAGTAAGQDDRFGFAVTEGDERRLVGHVVVKNVAPGSTSAEVGYWTAAHARGRGVAPRALQQLTDWTFTTIADLTHLDLLHQLDNVASCRVALKSGNQLVGTLPAAPPAFPLDGHRHLRAALR